MNAEPDPFAPPELGGRPAEVELGATSVAFEEAGDGEPPVILIHGIACDRRYLAPQFRHLSARHRTVAVDLRGHGESAAPSQRYTVQGFARDVARLCSQLDLNRPVLVGHSLGGLVALQAGVAASGLASGVVMLDPPLLAHRQDRMRQLLARLRGDGYPRELRAYFEAFFLGGDTSDLRDWILSEIPKTPKHVVISAWENGVFAFDDADALARCALPLLYVDAGTANADLRAAAELCATLSVERVTGAGHFAPLEVPEQVNAAIDRFIAELVGSV